ncbi:DNA gyrase inhibitor YacG [Ovoidimarina sediminis]|uniref:DNA gyrase inhibitor YacG n=1 Tax=Ovoidimarina sediminis TaxID=3079856 RepID=UPI002910147D|nr:DNA gyrase inhibitor YacG [Rhodophyticola sp. MJ-SS7]MDU8945842.1 DNA gyrase inhibitor YacG [Rhodophyticola sp. MJ-SS7]
MTCPICKKQTVRDHRPFCSQRCADLDLGRWMTGAYTIPVNETDDDDRPARPDTAPE